jgi:hypothetical protein
VAHPNTSQPDHMYPQSLDWDCSEAIQKEGLDEEDTGEGSGRKRHRQDIRCQAGRHQSTDPSLKGRKSVDVSDILVFLFLCREIIQTYLTKSHIPLVAGLDNS